MAWSGWWGGKGEEPGEDGGAAEVLAALLAALDVAVAQLQRDGTVRGWNEAAAQMFGYGAAEIEGQPVGVLFPGGRGPDLSTLGSTRQRQGRCLRKDGKELDVSLMLVPMRDAAGQLAGALMLARDITESLAAERARAEFVATASHALRTPLTSVRGALDLLASGTVELPIEEEERLLDIAARNARRLEQLIDDLLQAERLELGRLHKGTGTLKLPPPPPQPAAAGAARAAEPTGPLILVCDDDPGIRTVVGTMLERRDYRVICAASGPEAIQMAADKSPAAILLDLLMPEMDGWEVVVALKHRQETQHLPIVICSAMRPEDGSSVYSREVEWVVKPLDEELLFQALGRALKRHQEEPPVMHPRQAVEMALEQIRSFVSLRSDGRIYHDGTVSFIENAESVVEIVEGFLQYLLPETGDPVMHELVQQLADDKQQHKHPSNLLNAYIRTLAEFRNRLPRETQTNLAELARDAEAALVDEALHSPHLSHLADGTLLGDAGARVEQALLESASRWLLQMIEAGDESDPAMMAAALRQRAGNPLLAGSGRLELINEILRFWHGLQEG